MCFESFCAEFFNSTFLCERKRGRGKEMGDGGRENEREQVILEVKVGDLFLVFLYTLRKNNYLT